MTNLAATTADTLRRLGFSAGAAGIGGTEMAPDTAAAPFAIGLMFALAAGLALWALILLLVRWVA